MTEAQIHEKRHERVLSRREKRRARIRAKAEQADVERKERARRREWLADLGKTQEDLSRQALESRRTNPAMSQHPPKGAWNRVKAFFQRRHG